MQESIFSTLCDLCDEFDTYVRDLEPGPVRDRLWRALFNASIA
jgi:hypothetical protein